MRYDDGYVQLQKTINAQLVDGCASPCAGETTYTDPRDGKTYQLVEIGCQCWFEENLRFSDGINEITDGSDWADAVDAQESAWCFYENNSTNEATYGKIYSWGAVNSGNLCPNGWHIPSASEWSALIDHLGGEYFAGGKMKSTTGWNPPNTDATNSSGFTGLPGGFRFNGGAADFDYAGDEGYWWSSTQGIFPGTGRYHMLRSSSGAIQGGDSGSVVASFSCRCVKD